MGAKFEHAPGLGVFQDGPVVTVIEKDEFVEYPPACLLGPPRHDAFPGNLAVKYPVIADPLRLGLLPDQAVIPETHVIDGAPPPAQIDGTRDPIRAAGVANGIKSLPVVFCSVTQRHV